MAVKKTKIHGLPHYHPWPHRLALLLAVVTFPLISVGGLVTSYDAGMAVPDWPNTYGYNMFLYPWQTWLFGPWDLFIEHKHRLLGTLAGMINIAVVVAVYRWDRRPAVRAFSVATLVVIIAQGGLGGARVLLDARQLAMLHGCLGPAFFGMCIALCAVTSRWWQQTRALGNEDAAARLHRLAVAVLLLAYIQLVVGAMIRHVPPNASTMYFEVSVWAHLGGAALLLGLIVPLVIRSFRGQASHPALRWPAATLGLLLVFQLALGCVAWLVSFHWPTFLVQTAITTTYTLIESKGALQSLVITAHAANGTLILGALVLLVMRSQRLVCPAGSEPAPEAALYGSAAG